MPNYFSIYLATPDNADPLVRMKIGLFCGYAVSISAASAYYALALIGGTKVPQTATVCVRWLLTGMTAGVSHGAVTYVSAKTTGKKKHWVNHLVGGAAAGLLLGWHGPLSVRIHRTAGFATLSAFLKLYVDFMEKHPNMYVPRFGERDQSPYLTLNHRWMNPEWREQEDDLEENL